MVNALNAFALQQNSPDDHRTENMSCSKNVAPFAVLDKIRSFISRDWRNATDPFNGVEVKLHDHLVQTHTVKIQQQAIEKIVDEIVQERLHNFVVFFVDYLVTFEALQSRKQTVQLFWKKDFHGMALYFSITRLHSLLLASISGLDTDRLYSTTKMCRVIQNKTLLPLHPYSKVVPFVFEIFTRCL